MFLRFHSMFQVAAQSSFRDLIFPSPSRFAIYENLKLQTFAILFASSRILLRTQVKIVRPLTRFQVNMIVHFDANEWRIQK